MSIKRLLMAGGVLLLARLLVTQAPAIEAALPFKGDTEPTQSAPTIPIEGDTSRPEAGQDAPLHPAPDASVAGVPLDAAAMPSITDPQLRERQTTTTACDAASPAVVTIYAGREVGAGSIVTPQGLVLTSLHVVRPVNQGYARVKLANGTRYAAYVVARDQARDLAILQLVTQAAFPIVPLGASERIQAGEPVCAIGSPYGKSGTLSRGTLATIQANGDLKSQLRLNPGDSGGPLLNAQGELIGVNRSIWQSQGQNTGISFATSLAAAKLLLEQTRAQAASAPKPTEPVPTNLEPPVVLPRVKLGIVLDRSTLTIERVEPNSAAARAGLSAGDRVVAINGTPISSPNDVQTFMRQRPKTAVITIERGQRQSEVPVSF